MTTKKLTVNMHCSACSMDIEKALKKDIKNVSFSVPLQLLEVTYDESKISLNSIIQKIEKIGYDASEID